MAIKNKDKKTSSYQKTKVTPQEKDVEDDNRGQSKRVDPLSCKSVWAGKPVQEPPTTQTQTSACRQEGEPNRAHQYQQQHIPQHLIQRHQ